MRCPPHLLFFLSAREQVTQDESFKTTSSVTADALQAELQAAKQLLRWCHSGYLRISAKGVSRAPQARHLVGSGGMPPGKVWISDVLRSFLVQSESNGDRYISIRTAETAGVLQLKL